MKKSVILFLIVSVIFYGIFYSYLHSDLQKLLYIKGILDENIVDIIYVDKGAIVLCENNSDENIILIAMVFRQNLMGYRYDYSEQSSLNSQDSGINVLSIMVNSNSDFLYYGWVNNGSENLILIIDDRNILRQELIHGLYSSYWWYIGQQARVKIESKMN